MFAVPVISVNGGSVCAGQAFSLNPSGAVSYTYSSGTSVVTPNATKTYSVTGTGPEGCVSPVPAVATVIVHALPVISVNSGSICAGGIFTIIPSGANTYTIAGGSNTVQPALSASYTVNGTSLDGCESATPAIASVTVHALPNLNVSASASAACIDDPVVLTASGAQSYSWSTSQVTATVMVIAAPNVTIQVTGSNANGCLNSTAYTLVTNPCTGISSTSNANKIRVYPNPSQGVFNIEVAEETNAVILNSIGQVILDKNLSAGNNQIGLNGEALGMYMLVLKGANGTHTYSSPF